MIQLIAHLIGDFALQNDWMAENKGKFTIAGWLSCFIHCAVYSLTFLLITFDIQKLLLVFLSHFLIDKFRLAFHYCEIVKVGARFDFTNWLKVYLIFMVDMCFHLSCNYIILSL
jgi:hypothetical protein